MLYRLIGWFLHAFDRHSLGVIGVEGYTYDELIEQGKRGHPTAISLRIEVQCPVHGWNEADRDTLGCGCCEYEKREARRAEHVAHCIQMGMPYIDDYAVTCARHPDFEKGYQQWLTVVQAWGHVGPEFYLFTRNVYRRAAGL